MTTHTLELTQVGIAGLLHREEGRGASRPAPESSAWLDAYRADPQGVCARVASAARRERSEHVHDALGTLLDRLLGR